MEGIQWKAFYHTMTSLYVVIERCLLCTVTRKRKKDMYFFAGDVLTCLPEQRC